MRQEQAGGAQYVFDGTDGKFWQDVYHNSIALFKMLAKYNSDNMDKYEGTFPIQAWTAEMWATTWQFWKSGIKTAVVPQLDLRGLQICLAKWIRYQYCTMQEWW